MLEFAWPWAVIAALFPIIVARFLPPAPVSTMPTLLVPFFQAMIPSSQSRSIANPGNKRLLTAIFIWLCLITAACRPQWVAEPVNLPISGRNLMLAIDLSASMDELDMAANGSRSRFHIVREVAGDFIEKRLGDRIGLILFGSRAHVRVPLTFDRRTVLELLRTSNTGLAGSRTAIGDAIALAIKRLRQTAADSRVLVLLSDGESNTGVATDEALYWAVETGITIYTIGVGTELRADNPAAAINEQALAHIARQSGGRYFNARNAEELEAVYQLIDRLEPMPFEETEFLLRKDLFYWPLGLAIISSYLFLLWVGFFPRLEKKQ